MFLTRTVARCFTGLRHVPIVGPLNSVLGGCVGAIEGVLYLYLIVAVVSLILALSGDSIPYLNRQTLENTWFLRLFLEKNALGSLPVPDFSGYAAVGQAFYSRWRAAKVFSVRSFFHNQFIFAFYNEP